ncbi:MAG: T9SS type A sorting domain-containing protein [Bacteroidales bacterium]|jgi:hypothetical protein|nr:T9SS type A sorting domain-containing protein [Bacteroidales bacterium]
MKQTFLSVVFAVLAIGVMAQEIGDGGFENKWKEFPVNGKSQSTYWDFSLDDVTDLFMTLNSLYEIPDDPLPTKLTAFRETDAHSGNYAIKLQSVNFTNNLFVPGVLGTVDRNFANIYLSENYIEVEKPFAYKPRYLTGFFKYMPVNGDSAEIYIKSYNEGDLLGEGSLKIKGTFSEWTPFRLCVNYEGIGEYTDATHIEMLFIASAAYDWNNLENCRGQAGTALYLDDLAFDYEPGEYACESIILNVRNMITHKDIKVYPTPASHDLYFEFSERIPRGQITIYDLTGAEIASTTIEDNHATIPVANVANGIYFYKVTGSKQMICTGKVVVKH